MANNFDASSSGEVLPGTSLTYSHTVGTGSDRLLLVGVQVETYGLITGITYAGVAMTQLVAQNDGGIGFYLYGLLAPASGANNVAVSWDGSSKYVRAVSTSYTGVKQTGFPDATAQDSANGTSVPTTITTVAANTWIAGYTWYTGSASISGYTTRVTGSNSQMFDSNAPIATPSANTVTVTGSGIYCNLLVSFAPSLPITSNGSFLHNFA